MDKGRKEDSTLSNSNFRAWIKRFKIHEHPIIFIDRTIGESKMSRAIMFEAVWIVWRLRIWRIFGWNK